MLRMAAPPPAQAVTAAQALLTFSFFILFSMPFCAAYFDRSLKLWTLEIRSISNRQLHIFSLPENCEKTIPHEYHSKKTDKRNHPNELVWAKIPPPEKGGGPNKRSKSRDFPFRPGRILFLPHHGNTLPPALKRTFGRDSFYIILKRIFTAHPLAGGAAARFASPNR